MTAMRSCFDTHDDHKELTRVYPALLLAQAMQEDAAVEEEVTSSGIRDVIFTECVEPSLSIEAFITDALAVADTLQVAREQREAVVRAADARARAYAASSPRFGVDAMLASTERLTPFIAPYVPPTLDRKSASRIALEIIGDTLALGCLVGPVLSILFA